MIERKLHSLARIALFALALYAAGARADAPHGNPLFSFSGFGTLGVAHSSERQADFSSSLLKPNGAGYSHAWSADVDSLIGAQLTANFSPKLSGVLQLISEQNYDNTYRPRVEWANIKYQLTPDFSLRVGRTLLPTFLLSDTRNVSYTYPWVRQPQEVYRQSPITSSDGVDASYQMRAGDLTSVFQAHYGRSDSQLPNNVSDIKARQSWGLAYTGEYHAATLHIGYEAARISLNGFKPIFDGFRQFGPAGSAIADEYEADNKALSLITLGARYDPGKWFVMGEATHTVSRSITGKRNSWYVSGGYRHGDFTPYLTYGEAKADNLTDPGLNLTGLPPPLAGPAAGLNFALNSFLRTKMVQNTLSIGARWDFMRNTALKLQYDHTRIGAGSIGALVNVQPGFQSGGKLNVLSAAIAFVF